MALTPDRLTFLRAYAQELAVVRRFRAHPDPTVGACQVFSDPAPSLPSNIELVEENFVDLNTLLKSKGVRMGGKVLICRTLAPASKALPVCTLIEDAEGKETIGLTLFNLFPEAPCNDSFLDLEDVLPTGSYLAIKNPCFTSTLAGAESIILDNPADVDFLSEKWVKGQFPSKFLNLRLVF